MKQRKYLTLQDRKELERMYLNGDRIEDIAVALDVTANTVYNEIKCGSTGGPDVNQRLEYDPIMARKNVMATLRRRGPKRKESTVAGYAKKDADMAGT